MSLSLLLLLAADEVRPRWDREDCILVKGECYGLDVLQNCKLGPDICFRFGIEEVDPKLQMVLEVHAPCGVDGTAWGEARIAKMTLQYPIKEKKIGACDSARPRVDVSIEPGV
jgi:hypothetical protein